MKPTKMRPMQSSSLLCAMLLAAQASLLLAGSAQAQAALTVELVAAQTAPSFIELELTGTIEATSSVSASFNAAGRLIDVHADIGDSVAAGDVLSQMDATQAQASRRAAAAQLTAATASLTQAELARERAANLLTRGVGTQAELDAAEAGLLAARSGRDQAQSQLNKAEQAVDDTVLLAPASGIVTAREAEPGQIASAGQAIITLAPNGEREAVFYAPNVPQLDGMLGQGFAVTAIDGGDPLAVTVTEISPLANVSTGTVEVRARLDDGNAAIGLGTPITSTIRIAVPDTVTLPWSTLARSAGGPAVWRVDPETDAVGLVPVEIARFTTDTVEIASGLSDGDLIVAAGSHQLYPGRIVKPAESAR